MKYEQIIDKLKEEFSIVFFNREKNFEPFDKQVADCRSIIRKYFTIKNKNPLKFTCSYGLKHDLERYREQKDKRYSKHYVSELCAIAAFILEGFTPTGIRGNNFHNIKFNINKKELMRLQKLEMVDK